MTTRKEKKKETEERVRQAIEALILEKSYDSITIREICKKASISIGSYYNFYTSKDDIIIKAMQRSATITRDEIQPLLNQQLGIDNLAIYLQLQLDMLQGISIAWLKEIFRSYLYRLSDTILDRKSANYEVILKVVQQGQKDHSIQCNLSSEQLAWIILKMIIANFYCYGMEDGAFDLRKTLMDEVLTLCKR